MDASTNDAKAQSGASQRAASIIVSAIDEGCIAPSRWDVCRKLANELPDCDGLRDEALRATVNGSKDERARIAKELWQRETGLPFWQGAKFRILVGLTNDDGPMDGYESEYLVEFADLSGLSCDRIMSAFGLTNVR